MHKMLNYSRSNIEKVCYIFKKRTKRFQQLPVNMLFRKIDMNRIAKHIDYAVPSMDEEPISEDVIGYIIFAVSSALLS